MRKLIPISLLFLMSGCAIQYYDKATGEEHLWGLGHLKMRAVPQRQDQSPFTNAVMAYVTGVDTFGLNIGVGENLTGINAGWDSHSRVIIKQDNSSFYLLWPTNATRWPFAMNGLFTVRIGTNFPPELLSNESQTNNPINNR